jgi:hypothetical protein
MPSSSAALIDPGQIANPVWIYGDDDDTLFRLIALDTGKLSPGDAFGKLGY